MSIKFRELAIDSQEVEPSPELLDITDSKLEEIRSLGDSIDLAEVNRAYRPAILEVLDDFLEKKRSFVTADVKRPYLVGITGPVAVGKSTMSRLLQNILMQMQPNLTVDLATTDGFLKPNSQLEEEGILHRKGFPESYKSEKFQKFLTDVLETNKPVEIPVYSHLAYDITSETRVIQGDLDILVVEGVFLQSVDHENTKKVADTPSNNSRFDFLVYIDAKELLVEKWYVERFLKLKASAFSNTMSHFHRYASLTDEEGTSIARNIWAKINLKNLRENITLLKSVSDMVISKGENHRVESVKRRVR